MKWIFRFWTFVIKEDQGQTFSSNAARSLSTPSCLRCKAWTLAKSLPKSSEDKMASFSMIQAIVSSASLFISQHNVYYWFLQINCFRRTQKKHTAFHIYSAANVPVKSLDFMSSKQSLLSQQRQILQSLPSFIDFLKMKAIKCLLNL